MTFSVGLIAVLALKKMFRLNATYVGVIGALTGALFGFLMRRCAELRAAAPPPLLMAPTLHSGTLGAMTMPVWVGLVPTNRQSL
jgi:hypothetical protein